eukprot:3245802-Prymnesium_polylepis.2
MPPPPPCRRRRHSARNRFALLRAPSAPHAPHKRSTPARCPRPPQPPAPCALGAGALWLLHRLQRRGGAQGRLPQQPRDADHAVLGQVDVGVQAGATRPVYRPQLEPRVGRPAHGRVDAAGADQLRARHTLSTFVARSRRRRLSIVTSCLCGGFPSWLATLLAQPPATRRPSGLGHELRMLTRPDWPQRGSAGRTPVPRLASCRSMLYSHSNVWCGCVVRTHACALRLSRA